jgi:hypothetical protein
MCDLSQREAARRSWLNCQPARPTPATEEFLDADSRRRGDALQFSHRWRDGDGRYRVCWYEQTGELTAERLAEHAELDLEDFHVGVDGPRERCWRVSDARSA